MSQSWGYSGVVGEWHADLSPPVASSDLAGRMRYFLQVWDRLSPVIDRYHTIHSCTVNLTTYSPELEEAGSLEGEPLPVKKCGDLPRALEPLVDHNQRVLITAVFLTLNAKIITEAGESFAPRSAELYVGTNQEITDDVECFLYVSYSTLIDIWLDKTVSPDAPFRDNSALATRNLPILTAFLEDLQGALPASLEAGESYYYADQLVDRGFRARAPR